ncbi:hypothetical protein R2571_006804 [Pseudomonas aeruginosa]|nr:hypothetical protein [Pseudomonas aeruginosa]
MQRISVTGHLSAELLRANPGRVFVFGDNLIKRGTAGQAIIRAEPNAFGIPTKRLPSMSEMAFFSDREDEREALLSALRELFVLASTREIVFPESGLGTGLAQMAARSPMLYQLMCDILREHFGYEQPGGGAKR